MKLKFLAKIESGFLFQGRVSASEAGTYGVAQISGDPVTGSPSFSSYRCNLRWSTDRPKSYQFARYGDVIFQARGTPAAVLVREEQEKVIIPSHFFIVRDFRDRCKGEYLEWILNMDETRQYLKAQAQGSSLQFVSKSALGNLELKIPPLNVQLDFLDQIRTINRIKYKVHDLQDAINKLNLLHAEHLESVHRMILEKTLNPSEVDQ